ncbi:MAG: coproporphyrinogen III oxidase, partial [Eubacterium sp.]|nr:coproporphyrinogen III oxidase [Eubacterium sp.]
NTCDIDGYIEGTDRFDECQQLNAKDLQAEFMILGLRLIRGVEDAEFVRRFGKSLDSVYGPILSKYVKTGHLIRKDGRTYFSRTGISVSNTILADFL